MFRQIVIKKSSTAGARLSVTSTSRAFHSPFAVLASSPLTTPHNVDSKTTHTTSSYEKHIDVTPDPHVTPTGARTYVVSTPDPGHTHYEVPSGAYPNSSPYHSAPPPTTANAPGEKNDMLYSSTSSSMAHPNTTNRAPMNESGVGESASVRYRSSPGEMGKRGGGYGGIDLMDGTTTKTGPNGELADRNAPPLSKESESMSKKGNKNAWKDRK